MMWFLLDTDLLFEPPLLSSDQNVQPTDVLNAEMCFDRRF